MAALTPKSTRKLLAELIAASMIYEMEHDRYAMHDLLRALALDVVTPNEAVTIRHRMLNHYVATGCAAALSMNRNRAPIPPLPGSLNHQTIHFGSPESAMAWLESEYLTLCQCVDVAESSGHDAHAWRLAWAVSDLSIRRGRSDVLGHISRLALAAGQRLLDRRAQGYAARYLGIATLADGDAEQAARLLNVALDHFAAVDGVLEQAWVHNDLAAMHEHEPAVALRHARRFRALSKRAGHAFSVAAATDCVAWAHLLTGDLNRAFVWTKFALSLNEQHGDLSHGIAGNLHTIGRVSHALGDYESAVASYRKSAQRYKAIGRIAATVLSLRDMSISLHALGRAEEAEVARAEAERERRRLPT